MDIVSHGLWGAIAFGRRTRQSFITALLFGTGPDLLSFGVYFAAIALGISDSVAFQFEPPQDHLIPGYVHTLYGITHSSIVFAVSFTLISMLFRRIVWEVGAWGLHIALDIFTHSYAFFPTPFLWPLSDFKIDGIPWSHPEIFIPNVALLMLAYGIFVYRRYRNKAPNTVAVP